MKTAIRIAIKLETPIDIEIALPIAPKIPPNTANATSLDVLNRINGTKLFSHFLESESSKPPTSAAQLEIPAARPNIK